MVHKRDYRETRKEELIYREKNKSGFKGKVNAKCIECIYDPYSEGTWIGQITACTSYSCPLYKVRPKNSSTKDN